MGPEVMGGNDNDNGDEMTDTEVPLERGGAGTSESGSGAITTAGPPTDKEVLDELYRFYEHPNEELYRLLHSLGPGIGWSGKFRVGRSDRS